MFKTKTPAACTIETVTAELDAMLAKAAAAYVPADRLVDLLESRIAGIARRQVASWSASPIFHSGNI
jgi:hypothetical protein